MSWLSNFIRPKIRSLVTAQKDVPDNLWQKCPSCEGMLFSKDLPEAHYVCHHCGHHLHQPVKDRLKMLFDDGKYEEIRLPKPVADPLKFKDRRKYTDRIREAQLETKMQDAIVVAKGKMGGQVVVISAFNFEFMGGSMGSVLGERFVRGVQNAVEQKMPFICITASGGARMQEGLFSLMQMAKTTAAITQLAERKLPFITLLTDPTMGGVSASFAFMGDLVIGEPGALIGFAGPRVIEQTVRETLPPGFQRSEFLLEKGALDLIIDRRELRDRLAELLTLLTRQASVRSVA